MPAHHTALTSLLIHVNQIVSDQWWTAALTPSTTAKAVSAARSFRPARPLSATFST